MNSNLKNVPTSETVFTPAEVRVYNNLAKALQGGSLAPDCNGFLGHCKNSFLATRQGGEEMEEVKRTFTFFLGNLGFLKGLDSGIDPESPDFMSAKRRGKLASSREFRKILGTESLKLAEIIGKLKIPSPFRSSLQSFKTLELATFRGKRSEEELTSSRAELLAEVKSSGIAVAHINAAAAVIGEQIVLAELVATFYDNESARLIADAASLYETLVADGFKLGHKAWHDPLWTVANLEALLKRSVTTANLSFEAKSAAARLATFLQKVSKSDEGGLTTTQIQAIIAEYLLGGEAGFYSEHAEMLAYGENEFISELLVEAVRERGNSLRLLSQATAIADPFDAINEIREVLSLGFSSFLNRQFRAEMLKTDELSLGSEGHEILALSKKGSDVAKRANATRDIINKSRARRGSRLTVMRLSAQATAIELYAQSVENEIQSRTEIVEVVVYDDTPLEEVTV